MTLSTCAPMPVMPGRLEGPRGLVGQAAEAGPHTHRTRNRWVGVLCLPVSSGLSQGLQEGVQCLQEEVQLKFSTKFYCFSPSAARLLGLTYASTSSGPQHHRHPMHDNLMQ